MRKMKLLAGKAKPETAQKGIKCYQEYYSVSHLEHYIYQLIKQTQIIV